MFSCFDDKWNEHKIDDKTLLVFIDETGNELLKDPKFPIFGIGGCVAESGNYITNVRNPWHFLKNEEFDGENQPLHATDLRKPTESQIDILNKFFSTCAFGRFAVVMSNKTILKSDQNLYHLIVRSVFERINYIAQNSVFDSICIIIEESQRTDELNMDFFTRYDFIKNGEKVPVKYFIMSKKLNEPGLEVGDFIIHTAGISVRDRLSGKRTKEKERKDFEAVFKNVDQKLSSYFEITMIEDKT
jgi:hypothetical protein